MFGEEGREREGRNGIKSQAKFSGIQGLARFQFGVGVNKQLK